MRKLRAPKAITVFVCAALVLMGGLQFAPASPAQASAASDFNPGNIISDALFYDGNAMTAGDVQSFLNEQVPRCTIGDPGRAPGTPIFGTTVAEACLKDSKFSTSSRAANAYCASYPGSPAESAASIIAKVGRACGVSQKVLLVMLEKEQSLVGDTWPTVRQFSVAMGYACPDSGPNNSANCDPSQTGFMQQVYRAAWQIKVYKANPNSFNYRIGWNTIQWHPNIGCGTSQVYIENAATAGLYIYTPYRPNQAALDAGWGTGDACSTYGNRNFYLFYKTWFGATQQINHASLDSASGVYDGIRVAGWARVVKDSTPPTTTAYVWANVYDAGGQLVVSKAIAANRAVEWFNAYFPGYGNNHGFSEVLAVPPGNYRVELHNSSMGNEVFGVRDVTVPIGQGYVDSVTQTVGAARIQGWSVDFRNKSAADTIRVVLDGKTLPQTFQADRPTAWIGAMFPGAGNNHAFDFTVPASAGTHSVCIYGAVGLLAPCARITLAQVENGSLDAVERVAGGVQVSGWAVDLSTQDPSSISISVNGTSTTAVADKPVSWFNALYPGAGSNHGFNAFAPVTVPKSGTYPVCISGVATGKNLGCKDVTLLGGETTAFDSVTATTGEIRASGWSAVLGKPDVSYVWITLDGAGKMYAATDEVSWFDAYAPGSGTKHGFNVSLPATPGSHEVCVYTGRTGVIAGCKTAVVPKPTEQGHLDSVTAENGSIRATGWSHIAGQPASSYVWVSVDGSGKAYRADTSLSWFNAFAPGQGPLHGFDVSIPSAPGNHEVCVSGSNGPTFYGCRTVEVR